METKAHLIAMLRDEFTRWDELLCGLPEAQVIAADSDGGMSIKDIVAHLMTWQQLSVARLEAALDNQEPVFAGWPEDLDPDAEDDLEKINAWIFKGHLQQSWPEVHHAWRDGFHRFIDLAEATPEADLLTAGRYPWLGDYALAAVLQGSHEHHEEHLESLVSLLGS